MASRLIEGGSDLEMEQLGVCRIGCNISLVLENPNIYNEDATNPIREKKE
ncbi:hypothetical protein GCM10010911_24070 [Paenibacillus nasutitermitis]|uniref:Uncharacterized protein n=1 Tax=Paenibacillus nasutitermitis TaxID=1652958 RepID=A0A917DS09_9BACL|nr:hypothetical protein GCM10010911_24070 [Paenibacillus nasutitermitis]